MGKGSEWQLRAPLRARVEVCVLCGHDLWSPKAPYKYR